MRRRAFSRPRVSRDLRGVLRGETRAMKDTAVRRRASGTAEKKVERLRKFATECGKFTEICKSNSLPGRACVRALFRVNYRVTESSLLHARLHYAWLRRDLNYVIWIISFQRSFKKSDVFFFFYFII